MRASLRAMSPRPSSAALERARAARSSGTRTAAAPIRRRRRALRHPATRTATAASTATLVHAVTRTTDPEPSIGVATSMMIASDARSNTRSTATVAAPRIAGTPASRRSATTRAASPARAGSRLLNRYLTASDQNTARRGGAGGRRGTASAPSASTPPRPAGAAPRSASRPGCAPATRARIPRRRHGSRASRRSPEMASPAAACAQADAPRRSTRSTPTSAILSTRPSKPERRQVRRRLLANCSTRGCGSTRWR